MKTIRAIIVEDEPEAKFMLQALIERYCDEVELVGDASNVQEAIKLIRKVKPDLVFLDIEMPEEKGLHLFRYFEEINFEVIFTTAYDQYAINAIRLSALDYLLKPVGLDELRSSISNFKEKKSKEQSTALLYQEMSTMASNRPQRLALPSKNSFIFLNIDDIMYCQADGSYTVFMTQKGKKHLVAKSMKEYADLLEEMGFIRVHRSAIINLKYVEQFIRTRPQKIIMADGTSITIAQSRKQYLMEKLLRV
jgi:two-component system LytT family response regulator